jgi:hypothetical protein
MPCKRNQPFCVGDVWISLLTFPATLICHKGGKSQVHARCCQKITIEVAAYDQPDYCGEWISMDSCYFQQEDRLLVNLPRVPKAPKCKYKVNK